MKASRLTIICPGALDLHLSWVERDRGWGSEGGGRQWENRGRGPTTGSFPDFRFEEDFGGCWRRPTPQLSKTPHQRAGFWVPREGGGGASLGSWWSGPWAEATPASSCFLSNSRHFCRAPRSQEALLSTGTASWECGLALPSGLCGSWSPSVPTGSPLRRDPLPSAQGGTCTPTKDACPLRGECALYLCLGHLSARATHIHLWVHSSRPCTCQRVDRHADGTQDATCVCLPLSPGPAFTGAQATVTAAMGPRGVRADSPVGSLQRFCVGATCVHVRACCLTGVSVCVHARASTRMLQLCVCCILQVSRWYSGL